MLDLKDFFLISGEIKCMMKTEEVFFSALFCLSFPAMPWLMTILCWMNILLAHIIDQNILKLLFVFLFSNARYNNLCYSLQFLRVLAFPLTFFSSTSSSSSSPFSPSPHPPLIWNDFFFFLKKKYFILVIDIHFNMFFLLPSEMVRWFIWLLFHFISRLLKRNVGCVACFCFDCTLQ